MPSLVSNAPALRAKPPTSSSARTEDPPWLALVAQTVGSLNYGVVQIVVHDSQVVQVERTERYRFEVGRRT